MTVRWIVADRIMTGNEVHRRNQVLIRLGVGRLNAARGVNELGIPCGISSPKKIIWGTEGAVEKTLENVT